MSGSLSALHYAAGFHSPERPGDVRCAGPGTTDAQGEGDFAGISWAFTEHSEDVVTAAHFLPFLSFLTAPTALNVLGAIFRPPAFRMAASAVFWGFLRFFFLMRVPSRQDSYSR